MESEKNTAEEFYMAFFGVKEFNPEGTTINKSVIRFAEEYLKYKKPRKKDKLNPKKVKIVNL